MEQCGGCCSASRPPVAARPPRRIYYARHARLHVGTRMTRALAMLCAAAVALAAPQPPPLGQWNALDSGEAIALDIPYEVYAQSYASSNSATRAALEQVLGWPVSVQSVALRSSVNTTVVFFDVQLVQAADYTPADISSSYGSSIAMHPRCDVRCNIRSRRNSDLFDSLDAVKRRLKEVIGLPEPVFVERPIREPTKARIVQTLDAAPAPAAVSAAFTVVVNNAPWELVQALLAQNATMQPPSADGRTLTLTF